MEPSATDHTPTAARDTMARIQAPEPGRPLQFPGQYTRRAPRSAPTAGAFADELPAGAAKQERAREGGGAPIYRTPGKPAGFGTRLFNWLLRTA